MIGGGAASLLLACSGWALTSSPTADQSSPQPPSLVVDGAQSGRLRILTYNVAGLPELVSPSRPSKNLVTASPLLNSYDLVFAQEDWAYHAQLVQSANQPFVAGPSPRRSSFLGDGLSLLSTQQLAPTVHVPWHECSGYLANLNDCLADKGFTVTRVHVGPGAEIELVNLHADAGTTAADVEARRDEFRQLSAYLRTHSAGKAVIVAGDMNLEPSVHMDAQIAREFLETTGLSDSCSVTRCTEPGIDRVLYRSSEQLHFSVHSVRHDPRFIDERGKPLSDHPALAVNLDWTSGRIMTAMVTGAQSPP